MDKQIWMGKFLGKFDFVSKTQRKQVWMGKLLKKILDSEGKKVIGFLVTSRILFLVALFVLFIPLTPKMGIDNSFWDFLKLFGGRWDGNSYTFIAKSGYVTQGSEKVFIVFPPVYPILIKIASGVFNNLVLAGVALSNIFFVIGSYIFYKLLRFDYSHSFSFTVIILMAIFPTSYFFSVAYPESLFLLLLSLSFYLLHQKSYLMAALTAGFASFTRPFGAILWLSSILHWWIKSKKFSQLLLILIPAIIFPLIYLYLNYKIYGDPLIFQKYLERNWFKSFALPLEGIIASWKRGLFTPEWSSYKILLGYGEAIASTLAWIFALLSFSKRFRLKPYYSLYLLSGTIFFTSTGFILSAPRYLLSMPMFFIILAKILKPKAVRASWIFVSTAILFYLSLEFAQGRWAF